MPIKPCKILKLQLCWLQPRLGMKIEGTSAFPTPERGMSPQPYNGSYFTRQRYKAFANELLEEFK